MEYQIKSKSINQPGFRREGLQDRKGQHIARTCPASPKKREAASNTAISIEEDALWQAVKKAVAKALQAFVPPDLVTGPLGDLQSLRSAIKEILESIGRTQV